MRTQKLIHLLSLLTSTAVFLSGCDTFKEKVILSGKRETILSIDTSLTPDTEVAHTPVTIPGMTRNKDWPQAGGSSNHVMSNMFLPSTLYKTWVTNIGSGVSEDHRLTSGPVVGDGQLFTSDALGNVSAVNTKDGSVLWTINTLPEGSSGEAMGGGVAYHNGTVYCATSYGELIALSAKDGKVIWRKSLGAPSRVAPTIHNGHIYALTINNEIHALDTSNGNALWNHTGISEAAGILGGASPAVADGIVVAAYSSGEIFAFQENTGQPIWSDLLNPALRIDSVASIAHIRARPVISGGVVYIISHGGQMVALDLKTGGRLWQREIGGIRSPAVIGDCLFCVTNDADLVCVKKATGQIRWAIPLPKVDDEKRMILWAGPIVAGDSLILVGSNGQLIFASPQTGKIQKTIEIGGSSNLSPIAADGALYVLTDDANVTKYSGEESKS